MKYFHKVAVTLLCPFVLLSVFSQHHALAEPLESNDIENSKSVEERRILVSLQEEWSKIKEQQQVLNEREMELKTLQNEVDKQLNELKRIRLEVQELLAKKEAKEAANLQKLSKMYEKMEASKAALILTTLDKELAIDILKKMKQKSAGKILNNMDAETAASLSTAFSTLETD